MKKPFSFFILCLLLNLFVFVISAKEVLSHNSDISAVLSIDGEVVPGKNQSFLLYLLNDEGLLYDLPISLNLAFVYLQKTRTAELVFQNITTSFTPLTHGVFKALLTVPEDIAEADDKAKITVIDTSNNTILLESKVTTQEKTVFYVIPPYEQSYSGETINFIIGALGNKTATACFKHPIRVNLYNPSGLQTVNRIISTNINGLADYAAYFPTNALSGIYSFTFVSANNQHKIDLQLLNQNCESRFFDTETEKKQLSSITYREQKNSPIIEDMIINEEAITLVYNCENSSIRFLEIWQNGQIIFNTELSLSYGVTTVPTYRKIFPGIPLRIKIWHIKSGKYEEDQQIFLPFSETASHIQLLFSDRSPFVQKLANSLIRAPFFETGETIINSSNISMFDNPLKNKATNLIFEPQEILYEPEQSDLQDEEKYITSLEHNNTCFFLVEEFIDLSQLRFSRISVLSSPLVFYNSLIDSIESTEETNTELLLTSVEARALRFPLLDLCMKEREVTKLEGFLLNLIELHKNIKTDPQLERKYKTRLLKSLDLLSGYIFLPQYLLEEASEVSNLPQTLGPAQPILNKKMQVANLIDSLKKGGNISVESSDKTLIVSLQNDTNIFPPADYSFYTKTFNKLTNLRNFPVLIQLSP